MRNDDNHSEYYNHWLDRASDIRPKTDYKTKPSTVKDSGIAKSDKREDSDKSEPNSKRVDKKGKVKNCPVEPFLETLRLLEEWF